MAGSNKRQRNKLLYVRVLADEYERIVAKADKTGLACAAFLRAAALGWPGPRAQRRLPIDHKMLRQILGHIGRIGNNVNQIARALNAEQQAEIQEIKQALSALTEIRNAIFEALGKKLGPEP